jgi:hypothetical protein
MQEYSKKKKFKSKNIPKRNKIIFKSPNMEPAQDMQIKSRKLNGQSVV